MDFVERREFPRLQVAIPARVSGPNGTTAGEIKNISREGAAIEFQGKIGEAGDVVELSLLSSGVLGGALRGKIVRVEKVQEGCLMNITFTNVDRKLREALAELSDLLVDAPGGGLRKHSRVVRRIPIRYGGKAKLQGIAENISMKGMALVVESPLKQGDVVEVVVPHPRSKKNLQFRGTVVRVQPHSMDRKLYSVGLEFKEITKGEQERLRQLLRAIMKST